MGIDGEHIPRLSFYVWGGGGGVGLVGGGRVGGSGDGRDNDRGFSVPAALFSFLCLVCGSFLTEELQQLSGSFLIEGLQQLSNFTVQQRYS